MKRTFAAIAGVWLLCALVTKAATVFTQETWSTPGDTLGWQVTGSQYGSLSANSGYLQITGGSAVNGQPEEDFIGVTSAANLSGDVTGNYNDAAPGVVAQTLTFQFYDSNYAPEALSLYIESTNFDMWYYAVSPPATLGVWKTYTVSLSGPGWIPDTLGAVFATDIGSVSQVGLVLDYNYDSSYNTPGGQTYGLNNFGLEGAETAAPEPGTFAMMGVALLSLGFTFRRQIGGMVPVALHSFGTPWRRGLDGAR